MHRSVTLIGIVHEQVPAAPAVARFVDALDGYAGDVETVLVVSGAETGLVLNLKHLAECVPDLTVVFLSERVHDDIARLVGIEHAVGDAVVFMDLFEDDPGLLPLLLTPLADGYDLVVADAQGAPARSGSRLYATLFRLLTGAAPELRPTGLRVLSRAAALHVCGQADAELLVRARGLGPSFPSTVVAAPAARPASARAASAVRHSLPKAVGLMLAASTLPLRGASYAALLGGVLSGLYSLYVLGVLATKPDVAAGWTTLSLQVSGMMFIFSVVLLFLSEYVIQIYGLSPPRSRRHLVARELRSRLSRRAGRLNVVDAEGRYQLGKPAWLDA